MPPVESIASGVEFARSKRQRRQAGRQRADNPFYRRRAGRSDRVGERHELLGDVLMRIIENGTVQEVAAVEALLGESMEADANRRAAQAGENRARPREQFEIE